MKNVILIVSILSIFYSCNKEYSTENEKDPASSYLPMTVGNYWIYQEINVDTIGNMLQTSTIDSIIISKDTLINGKTYFRFDKFEQYKISRITQTRFMSSEYLRDSSKYLINSNGRILFSETNFTDTLTRKTVVLQGDTVYLLTCKMEKNNLDFTVPAGSFKNLLNLKGTVTCNPKFTRIKNPRYINRYYAQEVGEIYNSNIYITGGTTIEKRLLRFKIIK